MKPTRRFGQRYCALLLALLTVALSVGCGPEKYRTPISKFQAASAVVVESTRVYVSELNKVERDNYILEQVSTKTQIKLDEIEAAQVFSKEGLQARLDALDLLAGYGDLLSKVANSDAPEKVRAQADALKTSLTNLSTTTSGLTGADDTRFKAALGPVTSIIGEVLNFIVQRKITEALDKAILSGEAPVNAMLSVIGSDIEVAYERKRSAFSNLRVMLVDAYNRELEKGDKADAERLRTYGDRIRAHEDRWEEFGNANPKEGLEAMARAHAALVGYARSRKKIVDFGTLVDAMEAFSARAQRLGQAVQALREI
jgi:hypothetical protein